MFNKGLFFEVFEFLYEDWNMKSLVLLTFSIPYVELRLFTVHRQDEDDFKRPMVFKEERHFAVGDRLVFTGNDKGLGVNNGTLER